MKKLSIVYMFLVMASLITPSLVNADTEKLWVFQPRLTTGIMQYEFEYGFTDNETTDITSAATNEVNYADNMPFIGGGAMLLYNKCFADAYFQRSATGKDGSGTEILDTESTLYIDNNEFYRQDYAFRWPPLLEIVTPVAFCVAAKRVKPSSRNSLILRMVST